MANSAYMAIRVLTLVIAALYYVYGLSQISNTLDYEIGVFNHPAVRFSAFGLVALLQAYLVYKFVKSQRQRAKEARGTIVTKVKSKNLRVNRKKDKKAASEDDDLPEVDQATQKNLRSRTSVKAK